MSNTIKIATDTDLSFQRILYPRVSDIYAPYTKSNYDSISPDVLANAAKRGDRVEEYCVAMLKGEFLPPVEEEYEPFVNAFEAWANDNIADILRSKERLYDDERKFTGEYDMVVKLKSGEVALMDLKCTAAIQKFWPIQLSAYSHLLSIIGLSVDTAVNLQLQRLSRKKGDETVVTVKAKQIQYNDLTEHFALFEGALNLYDFFLRKEIK